MKSYQLLWLLKKLSVLSIWIFFATLLSGQVLASTYYVDNVSGLDTNDGFSIGGAWKTLSKATSIASAGDTVNVINNGPTNPFHERLAPARSGTSGSHIRFVGYNGSPYILGTIDYSHSLSNGWLWKPSSVSGEYYLTLNNANPGITQARVFATSTTSSWNSTGVDALNNRSTGTLGSLGAGQWNWGDNDTLGYSTIYYRLAADESDITTLHIEGGEDGAQHRNPILVAWQYIDIENFKVRFSNHHGILNQTLSNYVTYNNVDSSYTGRSGISNGIFTNMTITNCRFDHNGMISTVRADYTGIQLSGTTNSTITNNVISNGNNDSGINIKAASNNNLVANNIIFNNPQHGIDISTASLNNTIYNNTTYNNGEQGINVETNSTGNVIKNNILANNQAYQLSVFDSGSTTGLVLDNNLFYFSNPATNIIRFVGSFYSMNTFGTYKTDKSQDQNSLALNPLFLNGSGSFSLAGDFKLSRLSPAIDSGASVGISSDYAGTTVPQNVSADIGAYEYIPLTVTVNQAAGQSDPTSDSPINFTAVFSESVSDFVTGDVTLSGTAGATTATVTGSGTTYNIAVTGMNSSGTVIPTLAVDIATGASGNTNTASTGSDNNVTYTISSSSTSSNSTTFSGGSGVSHSPSCDDTTPASSPNLFQINTSDSTAKLFFTPIGNTNSYFISYSSKPNAEEHGTGNITLASNGVQSVLIKSLNPNTAYYFKVRGQNGCKPGDWGNIMQVKTNTRGVNHLALHFKNQTSIKNIVSPFYKKAIQVDPIITPLIAPLVTPISTPEPSRATVPVKPAIKKCYIWGLICF